MLVLYHGANSVCSVKVRIVLAEKGLQWDGRHIDLPKGEHLRPDYLEINPRAVVPVLEHNGALIRESTVICEYLNGLNDSPQLVPSTFLEQARMRVWGVNTLEYHDSVNTLTFSSYQRSMLLAKPAEELAARWEAMPDKIRVRKTLDLMEHGAESIFVPVAFKKLQRMCIEMEEALADLLQIPRMTWKRSIPCSHVPFAADASCGSGFLSSRACLLSTISRTHDSRVYTYAR